MDTSQAKKDKIKLAIIGCGQWGFNHVRTFSNLPDSEVVGVADMSPERLQMVKQQFPDIQCDTDYLNLLRTTDAEAVVIATPASTHYPLVLRAIELGKHVLCEKPLCESAEEAQKLAELASSCGLVLMVGHVFLFNPGAVKLKELITAGELGRPYYMSAVRTNLGPIRSDVNAAYDLAAHDISIFNWLLESSPESVSATGASFLRPGIEDVVFISLKYPNGTLANIQVSWFSPKKVRQITVVGSRKMANWDDMELNMPISIFDKGVNSDLEYRDYGEFLRLSMWDGDVRMPKLRLEEPLKVQGNAFLGYVRTGQIERSDGWFSLDVIRTLEAVSHSIKRNGAPVQLAAVETKQEPLKLLENLVAGTNGGLVQFEQNGHANGQANGHANGHMNGK